MVRIINAHLRGNERGQFVSLELQGPVELVQSQNTGRFYATAKRCFISSTFDLDTAKAIIGQELPGSINRISCEPYSYTMPENSQEIILSHTYTYAPPEEKQGGVMPHVQAEPIFS